jgi:hypothetical protein
LISLCVTIGERPKIRPSSIGRKGDEHLLTVLRYIEANPLRAALVLRVGRSSR